MSETHESRMKAFCGENGLDGVVVAARKTEQCLPVEDLKGGLFYKQKSSEVFMASIKGAGASGESVRFCSSL